MTGATDPDQVRFEDVDWDALDGRRVPVSRRTLAMGAVVLVLAAVFLYDFFLVPTGTPTIPGLGWNVTQLDWLFVLTLLALLFYVVVPLVRNRRLTMHYWRQFRKNKAAVASLAFLAVIFTVGTFGPLVIARPELNVLNAYQPPVWTSVSETVPVECAGPVVDGACHGTWAHPLGTTGQGKDILTLMVFGMRVSMQVGLIATLLIVVIGTAVGTTAAYVGGLVDEALMRYVDIQLTFPTFFLYLLLVYLFGGSLFLLIVIFGLTSWGGIARLVRSEALQRREEEYVDAAVAAGASKTRIITRHIVPNVSNTVITAATLTIPGLILAEAALSFIQLGDPAIPSWGQVIATGRGDLYTAWWISTIPGVFLFLTILAFNFLGEALRDSLDPRVEQ
ncbi:ABC transporter permease [Halorientalis brevis]|uniref:ABC transporter permease n=1 Tax=Halorientalis brevis TaxID=1126241 RepID=A0ABD6CJF3_9EURY|nr:ABC transporter permease [Halorientalis brevis]